MFDSNKISAIVAVLACSAIFFLGGIRPVSAGAVHFESDGEALRNARLAEEGRLIGFVGDVMEWSDGIHKISIDAPRDYTLRLTVKVQGRQIQIMETQHQPATCMPELRVNWPKPVANPNRTFKGVTTITVQDPQFGEPTGRTSCVQPSMVGCTKRKVILTATSEPAGAEIWINSERQEYRTNATLSVPYCTYESSKDVLIRLLGKTNCGRSIQLAPDARVKLNCALREPGR